jgi:Ca-activated chloride channel homolog
MTHARLDVAKDFLRAIFASLLVGLIWSMTAALLVLFLAGSASAATELDNLEKMERPGAAKEGALLLKTNGELRVAPTLATDVHMRVTGMINRVKVTQRFTNPSGEWTEGIYVFPLPEESAVDHLTLRVGERIIEGQIKERGLAKQAYETAKQEGKKASLVEQERPNIFTSSVANIGPNENVSVEIEYQETLRYDQGNFRLRFPMVVGPRYIPGTPVHTADAGSGWAPNTTQVSDASRITPPVLPPGQGSINPVQLKIELDAGFPLARIDSPYHDIAIDASGDTKRTITLRETAVPANRDFELVWTPQAGSAPRAALFTERKGDITYALAMVLPPDAKQTKTITLPREVVFVIDTSGSMAGESIKQAREGLLLALTRLKAEDRFNVIQFNSITDRLFDSAVPVTEENMEKAKRYVRGLNADGGTEMAAALKLALINSDNPKLLRQVIFMTDGSVGNDDELFKIIHAKLGDSRLFTVGIGSAPNSHFMAKAAAFGHGTFTYIGKITEVRERMTELFSKLENPVLTNIKVALPGALPGETWPERMPDLYAGEPIMLAAALQGAAGEAVFKGEVNGDNWSTSLPLGASKGEAGIGVLWARKKIGALTDSEQRGAQADGTKQAIVKLGLDHHLVTKYTSLVAVDVTPTRPADAALKTAAVPTNLPAGWDYQAVFGELPRTATPATLNLLLGAAALLLSALLWRRARID